MTNLSYVDEIFTPVIGYELHYEISNYGRIKSVRILKSGFRKNKILKGNWCVNKTYRDVCLIVNNEKKRVYIHRLVALHFVDNPFNYDTINHIDGDPSNNHYLNLEWCTQCHNVKDGFDRGRLPKSVFITRNKKKIYQYGSNGILLKEWESVRDAMRSGFKGCFVAAKNGSVCKGYLWSYEAPRTLEAKPEKKFTNNEAH